MLNVKLTLRSVSKIVRSMPLKFGSSQAMFNPVNKLQTSIKNFHNSCNLCAKMYLEHENSYAYGIMENKGYAISLNIRETKTMIDKEEFEKLLSKDWSKEHHIQIFEIFSILGPYCSKNGLCISNKIFDDFIDNLTDNIKHASDRELESLFYALDSWPETESIRTRNFIEVWAAMDDECLNRLKDWDFKKKLSFISLFFMLNVTKHSDFSFKCLQKLASKAKQLSPSQLVQTMFFVGVMRKPPFDMHNLEVQLSDHFDELSVDDLAIISMGFFKSKTPIRSIELATKVIDKIIENSTRIHEVSLAALLKVLRYSIKMKTEDKIYKLLDILQHEVPRLSVMCIVHIAILGTSTLTLHEGCLTEIANKMINSLSSARLKDLERLVLSYGTLNFVPHVSTKECFFKKIIEELRKPEREAEIIKHGRSLACCLNYLGLLCFYPVDLMNKVLDPNFLKITYGNYCYMYGREILAIHNTSLIYCAEATMNRLKDKEAIVLAKKYTDYMPDENYSKQYNVTEKMILDVMQVLKENRGGEDFVTGDHILTHHQRGDVIICNSHGGLPLPVINSFPKKDFGKIRRPPDDNFWITLVIAGRNSIIHGSNSPCGPFHVKVKELKSLGFHAILVPWTIYHKLETKDEKCKYLNQLIEEAIK